GKPGYLRDERNTLVTLLQTIFCIHGLPQIMVSDNARIFKSKVFTKFCKDNGIQHKFTAPGHPQTNGIAERNIQTLKQKLSSSNLTLQRKVHEILLRYRSTPLANGKSPAEKKLFTNVYEVRNLNVRDRVQARWYQNNRSSWRLGIIIGKFGKLRYLVRVYGDNFTFKRHIDQLRYTRAYQNERIRKTVVETPPATCVRRSERLQQTFSNKFSN
ncbi:hypothetical protein ILUMI_03666, partial [Ignelater luminosus]